VILEELKAKLSKDLLQWKFTLEELRKKYYFTTFITNDMIPSFIEFMQDPTRDKFLLIH